MLAKEDFVDLRLFNQQPLNCPISLKCLFECQMLIAAPCSNSEALTIARKGYL